MARDLWAVQRFSGTVRHLHESLAARLASASEQGRAVTVLEPTDRGLVLGSSQPLAHVDLARCAAKGVDVLRRRSGGAAVLVEPGALLWVDVTVPAGDPLWCPDVARATWWLGEAWAAALRGAWSAKEASDGFAVWKQPMQRRAWSERVCFAGVGAGEVVFANNCAKVVGISQRRSRGGAVFQCACLLEWAPERLVALLALNPMEQASALGDLASVAAGVGPERSGNLLDAFLAALPGL
ncbi:MAG: lipoyl protein ligase domain-containing protein [Acidimicrobiales bacterium]